MSFQNKRGMHPPVKKAITELQGLRYHLVAGASADINATVPEIKEEDTLVAAFNNNSGTLTTVDIANITIADGFARGSAVFLNVIATDLLIVNGLTYTGVDGAKNDNTEWIADSTDEAAVIDIADSINDRDGDNVIATAEGTTVSIRAVAEGTVGNAITFSSPDTTITETGGGTLINGTGVKASQTLTLSSAVAGDSVEVDGLLYTAVDSPTTGKFDEFGIGGSDTLTAVNLIASINGRENRPDGGGNVVASNVGAVVTITAIFFGTGANDITTVGSANITAGGATLAGGVGTGGAIRNSSSFDQLMLLWFNKR